MGSPLAVSAQQPVEGHLDDAEGVAAYSFVVEESGHATITATSDDFDTILFLLKVDSPDNLDSARLVDENDDGGLPGDELNSRIERTLEPGNYIIAVGSYDGTGRFTPSVSLSQIEDTQTVLEVSGDLRAGEKLDATAQGWSWELDLPEDAEYVLLTAAEADGYVVVDEDNVMVEKVDLPSQGMAAWNVESAESAHVVLVPTSNLIEPPGATVFWSRDEDDMGTAEMQLTREEHAMRSADSGPRAEVHPMELDAGYYTITLRSQHFDTFLTVVDGDGMLLASNDDFEGTDSQVGLSVSEPKSVVIEVSGYDESETGAYRLVVAKQNATVASESGSLTGTSTTVERTLDRERTTVTLSATAFDPYLTVYDADGNVVAEDDDSAGTLNSRVTIVGDGRPMRFEVREAFHESVDNGPWTLDFISFGGQTEDFAGQTSTDNSLNEWVRANATGPQSRLAVALSAEAVVHDQGDAPAHPQTRPPAEHEAIELVTADANALLVAIDPMGNVLTSEGGAITLEPSRAGTVHLFALATGGEALPVAGTIRRRTSETQLLRGTLSEVSTGRASGRAPLAYEYSLIGEAGTAVFLEATDTMMTGVTITAPDGSVTRLDADEVNNGFPLFFTQSGTWRIGWLLDHETDAITVSRIDLPKLMDLERTGPAQEVTIVRRDAMDSLAYPFNLPQDAVLEARLRGRDGFDGILTLSNALGVQLAENDDEADDPTVSLIRGPHSAGNYRLSVRGYSSPGAFDLLAQAHRMGTPVTPALTGIEFDRAIITDMRTRGPLVGEPLPELSLTNPDGQGALTLASLDAKVLVLDFWASWCGPCIQAMPDLEEIHNTYKDRGVVVLGINDENPGSITNTMQRLNLTYPQSLDTTGDAARAVGVTAIPRVMVINSEGTVVGDFVGVPDKARLIAIIESAL